MNIASEIFRAYDIRGIVDVTLTKEAIYNIGLAFGTKVIQAKHNNHKVVVGRDGRLSGPTIADNLISALLATGCEVINIGQVPTPLLYFACQHLNIPSGIMITGSHNPPTYNGLKMILDAKAIYGDAILELRELISKQSFISGTSNVTDLDIVATYIDIALARTIYYRPMKVVIDAGNGIAGAVAPTLLRKAGHEVIELFCEVDGTFPNHHPDPGDPHNLVALIAATKQHNADIGLAFDGDGDRLGIIDNTGKIIWPDRALMALAEDILQHNQNRTVIYDIKSTQSLAEIITKAKGKPLMWKTGHSLIKAKMLETNAILAAEMSGHIFIADRWFGFDDALYAALRILELLSAKNCSAYELFASYPEYCSTAELQIDVTETEKFSIVANLISNASFPKADAISTLDGLRVDFANSWGLVRASNTSPKLIVRFEGKTTADLTLIKEQFRDLLLKVAPHLVLPF